MKNDIRFAVIGVILMGIFGHWGYPVDLLFGIGAILCLPLAMNNVLRSVKDFKRALKQERK